MRLRPPRPSRRDVLAGFGGIAACAACPPARPALGQVRAPLVLTLGPTTASLQGSYPPTQVWDFIGAPLPSLPLGEAVDITVTNELPQPFALTWRGCDGGASIEPLAAQPPVPPGQSATQRLDFRQAGTLVCDARLLGDGLERALPATALRVLERQAVTVDADYLVSVADWRRRPDGSAAAPGSDPGDAAAIFTVNGGATLDLTGRPSSRLRLRFINACQRAAISIKLDQIDVWIMAIDGRPAEPFTARNGQIVLAAGSRVDAFVDVKGNPGTNTAIWLHDGVSVRPIGRLLCDDGDPLRPAPLAAPRPLPDDGRPDHMPLRSAHRVEVPLALDPDQTSGGWRRPADLRVADPPAFGVRRGATVVLNLVNRAPTPMTFHLHGHPMRWLDRLDDGWKPFWIDTVLLQGGQTIRTAFVAEHSGPWLMEAMGTDWSSPRLARWYAVD
jgi:FtsP/CotA-like multicopper oxidase with cupredoxin domain